MPSLRLLTRIALRAGAAALNAQSGRAAPTCAAARRALARGRTRTL